MMDPFLKKRRPLALTAAVTFMAVSGALVGASLKSRQQINGQEVVKFFSLLLILSRRCPP